MWMLCHPFLQNASHHLTVCDQLCNFAQKICKARIRWQFRCQNASETFLRAQSSRLYMMCTHSSSGHSRLKIYWNIFTIYNHTNFLFLILRSSAFSWNWSQKLQRHSIYDFLNKVSADSFKIFPAENIQILKDKVTPVPVIWMTRYNTASQVNDYYDHQNPPYCLIL